MNTRSKQRIVMCTVIAGALSWSLPAAAADNGVASTDAQIFGITGRSLNDGEMSDMRGRFTPGSRVTIRHGDTVYTDSNPTTPGSSTVTVNLGPGSVSRGFASTGGTGGSASGTVSITLSGVTVRTNGH